MLETIAMRTSDDEGPRSFGQGGDLSSQSRRGSRSLPEDETEGLMEDPDNSDDEGITSDEQRRADRAVMKNLAINGVLIGLWYTFSLLISVYNKWMFSPDHLDFHFPLFVSSLHMIIQFSLSGCVLYFVPHLRPAGLFGDRKDVTSVSNSDSDSQADRREGLFRWNNAQDERRKRNQGEMTNWTYLTRIAPCGAATGLDIGLGNMSLKFITLAFYTMCKSSSLAFVLLFAFAFRLEKPTWKLVTIIGIMTLGVIMMVAGEAKFILLGFILVIVASALSGLRWSLTQILLLRNPATSNPFSSIFYLAPCMFAAIFIIAIPVEGFGPLFKRIGELAEDKGLISAVGLILFPGVIAFCMVSSEFALLKRSSVVTLSICGIFKEVMTISAATLIFGDPLTPTNLTGLLVTIVSIAAYNYIKVTKMREEALKTVHVGDHPHHHPSRLSRDGGYSAVGNVEYEDEVGHLTQRGVAHDVETAVNRDRSLSPIPRVSFSQRGGGS